MSGLNPSKGNPWRWVKPLKGGLIHNAPPAGNNDTSLTAAKILETYILARFWGSFSKNPALAEVVSFSAQVRAKLAMHRRRGAAVRGGSKGPVGCDLETLPSI